MSDNQHKIKTAKKLQYVYNTYSYRNTRTKSQLHNYEYSYMFINNKKCIYN